MRIAEFLFKCNDKTGLNQLEYKYMPYMIREFVNIIATVLEDSVVPYETLEEIANEYIVCLEYYSMVSVQVFVQGIWKLAAQYNNELVITEIQQIQYDIAQKRQEIALHVLQIKQQQQAAAAKLMEETEALQQQQQQVQATSDSTSNDIISTTEDNQTAAL